MAWEPPSGISATVPRYTHAANHLAAVLPIVIEILLEELILPTSADTFVLQRAIDEASTVASAVSDLVEADNNWFRDPRDINSNGR